MEIREIVAQAENLIGETVSTQGDLIVLQNSDSFISYLFSPEDHVEDAPHQIQIDHSIAELKAIMRPMPLMELIYQGTLTNPPYFYRFPLELQATIDKTTDNHPLLTKISSVRLSAPYGSKFHKLLSQDRYEYQAQVNYDPAQLSQDDARARIHSQSVLHFRDDSSEALVLQTDDNRYVRGLLKRKVKIPGWLRYLPDQRGDRHFVLRTFALRTSFITLASVKDLTTIWWQPSPYYQVVRAHIAYKRNEGFNVQVEITGKFDYLKADAAPIIQGGTQPKLIFTDVEEIVVHDDTILLKI